MNRKISSPAPFPDGLEERAKRLGLYGLLAPWSEVQDDPTVARLIQWEEEERQRRSLERRLNNARIGRFKPMADFDWSWPRMIDREAIEELCRKAPPA